jgi:N-acylneuraminate cytidylyltransferase
VAIKAVITDCDGCLTDNGVYYLPNGVGRRFNVLDGHGFKLLHDRGTMTAILTASHGETITARANWLKTDLARSADKAHWMLMYADYNGLSLDEIAYMGNDVIDLGALKLVGLAACPNDAVREVITYCANTPSGFVCRTNGGFGAFREFVDFMFARKLIST